MQHISAISAAEVIAYQRAYLRASNARRMAVVASAARLPAPGLLARDPGPTKQETPATMNHEGLTAHHLLQQGSEGRCAHCDRPFRQ
jgi:hypothetical protein